jgi:hypothetical protein
MASTIYNNNGNELPAELVQQMLDSEMVFQVRLDRKRKKLVFLGTTALTECLEKGWPLEEYLTEKVGQAREALVKQQ